MNAAPAPARLTRFVLIMVIVTVIRLAALPLRGTEDVLTWKIWVIAAAKNVTAVYGVGGHPPVRGELHWLHHTTTVDYPPVALYELGAAGMCIGCLTPHLADRPALTAAVKIPGLIFGIALTSSSRGRWTTDRSTANGRSGSHLPTGPTRRPSQRRSPRLSRSADDAAGDCVARPPPARVPEWAGASLAIAM